MFNQKGKKALPAMISSSDLDGDEYYILFDQELIFRGTNREPLPYNPKSESNSGNNKVTEARKVKGTIKQTLQENMMNHMHS